MNVQTEPTEFKDIILEYYPKISKDIKKFTIPCCTTGSTCIVWRSYVYDFTVTQTVPFFLNYRTMPQNILRLFSFLFPSECLEINERLASGILVYSFYKHNNDIGKWEVKYIIVCSKNAGMYLGITKLTCIIGKPFIRE